MRPLYGKENIDVKCVSELFYKYDSLPLIGLNGPIHKKNTFQETRPLIEQPSASISWFN